MKYKAGDIVEFLDDDGTVASSLPWDYSQAGNKGFNDSDCKHGIISLGSTYKSQKARVVKVNDQACLVNWISSENREMQLPLYFKNLRRVKARKIKFI